MISERLAASAALDLLADGANWIQGNGAVDSAGKEVWPTHPSAVRFSVWGAIKAAKINDESKASLFSYLSVLIENARFASLDSWNDAPSRTWSDVHAMLRKIIESKFTK